MKVINGDGKQRIKSEQRKFEVYKKDERKRIRKREEVVCKKRS